MNPDDDDPVSFFDAIVTRPEGAKELLNGGQPLIYSAKVGNNGDVFPSILHLYVAPKAQVADVTYGKGAFWRNVPVDLYETFFSDLNPRPEHEDLVTRWDVRKLPYRDQSFDAVVFDPPYMHSGGSVYKSMPGFDECYRNNDVVVPEGETKKWHDAVLQLYYEAAHEAHRVLRPKGIYIVKCQDEVCAHRQRLTHVELVNFYEAHNFIIEDLFVIVATNKPGVSRMVKQQHSRHNHSYFIVARKKS